MNMPTFFAGNLNSKSRKRDVAVISQFRQFPKSERETMLQSLECIGLAYQFAGYEIPDQITTTYWRIHASIHDGMK